MKGGKQLKLKETAFPPLNLPWPITAPKKLALWICKHTNVTLVSFASSIYPPLFFFCFSDAFPTSLLFSSFSSRHFFCSVCLAFFNCFVSNHELRLLCGFWTKYRAKRRAMAAFDSKCFRARDFDQNFYRHGGRMHQLNCL